MLGYHLAWISCPENICCAQHTKKYCFLSKFEKMQRYVAKILCLCNYSELKYLWTFLFLLHLLFKKIFQPCFSGVFPIPVIVSSTQKTRFEQKKFIKVFNGDFWNPEIKRMPLVLQETNYKRQNKAKIMVFTPFFNPFLVDESLPRIPWFHQVVWPKPIIKNNSLFCKPWGVLGSGFLCSVT